MKIAVGILLAAVVATSVNAGSFDFSSIDTKELPKTDGSKASKFPLGIGPEVVPSGSSSWNLDWSESGSDAYTCDSVCPADKDPLCGTDGVTYDNECKLTVAQCNATELAVASKGACASSGSGASTACPDACTADYNPVTDEDGKVYSNSCMMRIAKCKDKTTKVNPLAEAEKLYGRPLFTDSDSGESGSGSSSAAIKMVKSSDEGAEKTTKSTSTKSGKGGNVQSSVGSLFSESGSGMLGGSGSADPTLVKETPIEVTKAPIVEGASKTTKVTGTKSGKGGDVQSSVGSLFSESGSGMLGGSGSADPTLVKETPIEVTKAPIVEGASKTTKVTGTKSGKGGDVQSSVGSLFSESGSGMLGGSGSADPTLVKETPIEVTKAPIVEGASKTTKVTGTKSGKGGDVQSSVGSLFSESGSGMLGGSGSADPTLVKETPIEVTKAPIVEGASKTTKVTGTKSGKGGDVQSSVGSLFSESGSGTIGGSAETDPTLVKGTPAPGTAKTAV